MKVSLGKYPKNFNKERKISVKIDPWDTWSMDHTLALIIHPMLVQLQKDNHGAPYVDDEDVPDGLKSTSASPKENEWDTDANHFLRWDWVLNEMIWAFAQKLDDRAEDQFHSGEHDLYWKRVDKEGNEVDVTLYKLTENNGKIDDDSLWEMVKGPNDTHVFDKEGWDEWSKRKSNGFRLFGKYYEALWD